MEFLQEVQKNFVILGIRADQARINRKSLVASLLYGLGTTSSVVFLIREADTFEEYTNNLYVTSAFAVGFTYYTIMVYKMEKIFKLIKDLKEKIEESKYIAWINTKRAAVMVQNSKFGFECA